MVASSSKKLTLTLLADHRVVKGGLCVLQFFSQHSSARVSESCSSARLVSAYIVALFQRFRMVPVSCSLGRGEQKRATKNRTPVARGTIEPSANNGFPTRSGKKLQLETLDLDSRLIGL